MDVKNRKAEQSATTRSALIGAARALFAEHGYAGIGTEEIVRAAGVTRGALYHHFDGKRELFRAVYETTEAELVEQIASDAMSSGDPVTALHAGARAFLDAVEDPAVQRIALLDAPSVLGWEAWREIGMRYGLGLIQATLQAAMDAGKMPVQPVTPLAHLLLGALDEAALLVARSDDVRSARREVGEAIERLLDALTAA